MGGDHVGETRWILEAAQLRTDPVWLGRDIPRGDGRGVVLVPGFGGGDYTLAALAGWLRRMGYRPAVCRFVLNADCSERALERVERTRRVLVTTGRARRPECVTYRCPCSFTAAFSASFPTDRVRLTSIYSSKDDGVVRWQAQLLPYADCVEVTGSRVGLIVNRQSYRVIAQALAASELTP